MKKVLCFGDSNTYGYNPEGNTERFGEGERWTGLLQAQLKQSYQIIEAGANGRTICQGDTDLLGSNSSIELPIWLEKEPDTDLLILMLGSNDLKTRYGLSALTVAQQLAFLLEVTKQYRPDTLIIAPPPLLPRAMTAFSNRPFGPGSLAESQKLAELYRDVAQDTGCGFLNAGSITLPGHEDGVHFNREGHKKISDAIYEWIQEQWKKN